MSLNIVTPWQLEEVVNMLKIGSEERRIYKDNVMKDLVMSTSANFTILINLHKDCLRTVSALIWWPHGHDTVRTACNGHRLSKLQPPPVHTSLQMGYTCTHVSQHVQVYTLQTPCTPRVPSHWFRFPPTTLVTRAWSA